MATTINSSLGSEIALNGVQIVVEWKRRIAPLILSQLPTMAPSRSSLDAMTRFPEPKPQDEHER